MLKTLVICAVASASVVGCSSTAPRGDAKTASAAEVHPCVLQTASRIPARPEECSASPGRSYSENDVERTGKTQAGDALPLLDPSITVHH